jgi:hypothetical protein
VAVGVGGRGREGGRRRGGGRGGGRGGVLEKEVRGTVRIGCQMAEPLLDGEEELGKKEERVELFMLMMLMGEAER